MLFPALFLQRRELIGSVDFSQKQQKYAREQDVLEGSQDVTASLRRTRQLMMQNLEQTQGNISVLGERSKLSQVSHSQGRCRAFQAAKAPGVLALHCAPGPAAIQVCHDARHPALQRLSMLHWCTLLCCCGCRYFVLCCCRYQQQAAAGCG
jgi:hypothetical protein